MKCKKCGSINLGIRKNFKNDMHTDIFCKDCGAWIKFANKEEIIELKKYTEETEENKINKQLQFYQDLLSINKDCTTCDYNIEDDTPFVNCTSNIECINKNMWKLKTLK